MANQRSSFLRTMAFVLVVFVGLLMVVGRAGAAGVPSKATGQYDHLAEATRAIVEEISSLETKMGLYNKMLDEERKKIAVLKKLREELLKGSTVFGSDGSSSWTIDEISEYVLSHASNGYRRARFSGSAKGKGQVAAARDPREAYYNFFVKRAEIPFYGDANGQAVVDVDVLAVPLTAVGGGAGRKMTVGASRKNQKSTSNVLNLLVVTMKDRSLHVYDVVSRELLTAVAPEGEESGANAHKSDCVYFHFDAFCLTTNDDGSVAVNTFTIYNGGKFVSGHRLRLKPLPGKQPAELNGRTIQTTEAHAKFGLVPRTGMWVRIESKTFRGPVPAPEEGPPTSPGGAGNGVFVRMVGLGRMKMILIGDTSGALEVYFRNGTLSYVFPVTTEKPILAMTHSLVNVAVSHGKAVHFYNPSRHQVFQHICHGGMGDIVSLAYDKLLAQVLYAASDDGTIYVFNTRSRTKRGVGCQLLHQLRVNFTETLFTAKGYLVSVGNNELNMFNTSSILGMEPPALIASHPFQDGKARGASIFSMTNLGDMKTPLESIFAILLAPSPGEKCDKEACPTLKVDLFTTLLKYSPPTSGGDDLGWFRAPLMVMAVIGVFVYQLQGKKGGRGGGASFPGMPGIGGALSSNEKDELKSVLERYGGADAFANRRGGGGGRGGRGRRGFPPM